MLEMVGTDEPRHPLIVSGQSTGIDEGGCDGGNGPAPEAERSRQKESQQLYSCLEPVTVVCVEPSESCHALVMARMNPPKATCMKSTVARVEPEVVAEYMEHRLD
jgi:hypothetical protein